VKTGPPESITFDSSPAIEAGKSGAIRRLLWKNLRLSPCERVEEDVAAPAKQSPGVAVDPSWRSQIERNHGSSAASIPLVPE
jgi:hypothetical protein